MRQMNMNGWSLDKQHLFQHFYHYMGYILPFYSSINKYLYLFVYIYG
jgi:hypothetical protein